MLPYYLSNFEIQKFYQNEYKFNGVYSRNNLPKIKDGIYVIKLDEHNLIDIHYIALYVNNNNATYFDSFEIKHIPKETKKFIGHINIMRNIYRIQPYDLVICGYFCIGFIDLKR